MADHLTLEYLDRIVPLLRFPFDLIAAIRNKLFSISSSAEQIEFISVSEQESFSTIKKLLDNESEKRGLINSIRYLIDLLSFNTPVHGKRIAAFDILTALCIFCSAPMEQKALFLFQLFNINQSGLMIEEEHNNFMLTVVQIFRKMKLISSLDWSENDLQFYAIQARSFYHSTTNEMNYIPGLSAKDFLRWLVTSSECRAISKAFEVLNKLAAALLSLKLKATAIADFLTEKERFFCSRSDPAPRVPDHSSRTTSIIYPIGRQHSSVSICYRKHTSTLTEVFIRIDKHVKKVIENSQTNSKSYSLTCYQRHSVSSYGAMERLDVGGLSPSSLYKLTVYTSTETIGEIEMRTLEYLSPQRKLASTTDNALCILPGSLIIEDAEKVCSYQEILHNCSHIVFTGTFCPLEETVLRRAAYLGGSQQHDHSDMHRFAAILQSTAESIYHTEWEENVRRLYGLCAAYATNSDKATFATYCCRVGSMQVSFFPGMGLWSDSSKLSAIMDRVGAAGFKKINEALSAVYAEYVRQTIPGHFCRTDGSMTSLFVGGGIGGNSFNLAERIQLLRNTEGFLLELSASAALNPSQKLKDFIESVLNSSSDPLPSMFTSPLQLLEYLEGRLEEDAVRRKHTVMVPMEKLVLIMPSPLDLLATARDLASTAASDYDSRVPASATDPPVDGSLLHTKIPPVSEEVKITGKYEILHGEYRKPPLPAAPPSIAKLSKHPASPSEDGIFRAIVNALFAWLRSGVFFSNGAVSNSRSVCLVCTAWVNGENMQLSAPLHESDMLSIPWHSLLPKSKKTASIHGAMSVEESNDYLIQRMRQSLGKGVKLSVEASSATARAVYFKAANTDASFIATAIAKADKPKQSDAGDSAVKITDGPTVARLSDDHVIVHVSAAGRGTVTASLYEFPIHMNIYDIKAIIGITQEREPMQKQLLGKQWMHMLGPQRQMLFRFYGLRPYCCYGVVIDYGSNPSKSVVAHFRTFKMKSSPVACLLLSAVTPVESMIGSSRMDMLDSLIYTSRATSAAVQLCDNELIDLSSGRYSMTNRRGPTIAAFNKQAFTATACATYHHLASKRYPLSHFSFSPGVQDLTDGDLALHPVYVTMKGHYCYILPRNQLPLCLQKLVEIIYTLGENYVDVKCIVLITPTPLIRYLKKKNRSPMRGKPVSEDHAVGDGGDKPMWFIDGALRRYRYICQSLLYSLGWFKGKAIGNDCKIICMANVRAMKCVLVTVHEDSSKYVTKKTQEKSFDDDHKQSFQQWRALSGSGKPLQRRKSSFHHFILPTHRYYSSNLEGDDIIILKGKQSIGKRIEFELLTAEETSATVFEVFPKEDLYNADMYPESDQDNNATTAQFASVEPIIYRIELLLSASVDYSQPNLVPSDSTSDERTLHHAVFFRQLLDFADTVDLTFGPVIGNVSSDSAKIFVEVNMDLVNFEMNLRPSISTNGKYEPIVKTLEKVRANHLECFDFTELAHGSVYDILLPSLFGYRVLGILKTLPLYTSYAQVAFVANYSLRNLPMVDNMLAQLVEQQSPDLLSIGLINSVNYRAEIATKLSADAWTVIGNHLRLPGNSTAAVFHIGSYSIVCSYIDAVINALVNYTRKLKLPVRDSTLVQAYYFKQLDEVIKDTFRFVSNMQCVKEVFSVGSHVPLYHSDYLLPLSKVNSAISHSITESFDDLKLFQILQKVFSSHIHGYISSLYGYSPSQSTSSGHFNAWRFQTTVVVNVDIASGRAKVKKGAEGDMPADSKQASSGTAAAGDGKDKSFSYGFLDRMQWKRLREISLDNTIIYLVIASEKPVIPCTAIPDEIAPPPSELAKGEILPWAPTTGDLRIFFQFWFDWLGQFHKGLVPSARNLVLVSTADVPYCTTIQDIQSGLKISQICMANACYNETVLPVLDESEEVVLQGKIGNFRYSHRFGHQEYQEMESVRGESSEFVAIEANQSGLPESEDVTLEKSVVPSGVAVLKMWFDTWKSLAIWSTVSSAITTPFGIDDSVVDAEALLLVGPIIGAPTATTIGGELQFFVPIMIELDSKAVVEVVARSLFSSHELFLTFEVPLMQPYVMEIGPLEIGSRYSVNFKSGVKRSRFNSFVLNTHHSWNESNIAVVNCAQPEDVASSSAFMVDLTKRCTVPFHGVTAVVHIQFEPNVQKTIMELKRNPLLWESLAASKLSRTLSPKYYKELKGIIEIFRDKYRNLLAKPSYRELLRNSYNLLMMSAGQVTISVSSTQSMASVGPPSSVVSATVLEQDTLSKQTSVADDSSKIVGSLKPPLTEEASIASSQTGGSHLQDGEGKGGDAGSVAGGGGSAVSKRDNAESVASIENSNSEMGETHTTATVLRKPPLPLSERYGIPVTDIERFLCLIVSRLNQEYFEQLSSFKDPNMFRATRSDMKGKIIPTPVEEDPVTAVFQQWLDDLYPAPSRWNTWVSPNEKCTVERRVVMTALDEEVDEAGFPKRSLLLQKDFEKPDLGSTGSGSGSMDGVDEGGPGQIESGTRIIILSIKPCEDSSYVTEKIISGLQSGEEFDDRGARDVVETLRSEMDSWVGSRHCDREAFFVCPLDNRGTKKVSLGALSSPYMRRVVLSRREKQQFLYFIDSIYRNNENIKVQKMAELNQMRAPKKVAGAAAKSKRAKLKRLEEEKQRQLEMQKEIEEVMSQIAPDGYYIFECRQSVVTAINKISDDVCSSRVAHLTTILLSPSDNPEQPVGDYDKEKKSILLEAPFVTDYIMLPEWLMKFLPSTDAVFVQDDVLLMMRQHPPTKAALDLLEDKSLIPQIIQLYAESRLSELSRPPDLREVDITDAASVALFTKDLAFKLWKYVIPASIKDKAFSLCDDFIFSFCISKALSMDMDSLASAQAFAEGYLYAVILSISLKTSLEMASMEKYKYVMESPDAAVAAAKRVQMMEEEEEKRLAAEALKRKKEKAAMLGIELESPPAKSPVKEKAGEDDGEDADEEAVAGDVPEAGAELDEDQLIEAEAVAADKIVAKAAAIKAVMDKEEYESDVDQLEEEVRLQEELLEKEEAEKVRKVEEGIERTEREARKREAEAESAPPPDMDEVALQQFRKEQADLLLDVLREVELAILDSELAGCFDAAVALEIQDDIVREEAAALRRRMNMTEDQRITEAMQYLQRLTVERVKQRRNLGKRATFLTENIT